MAEMAAYHEELEKTGALLDASGLQPSSKGGRIQVPLKGSKPSSTVHSLRPKS